MKKLTYNNTIIACYMGYIVQAIVNNFVPLLFLTFRAEYGISLDKIAYLITINFGIQLLVDLVSTKFVDVIGYRASAVIAHVTAALGLFLLGVLPDVFPNPYAGILVAVVLYAIGGGLLEVIVSPIVEACPTEKKDAAMSLLHSFYCWGHMGVVIISTIFFSVFGIENWRIMAYIWALVPIVNIVLFLFVPINTLVEEGEGMSLRELVKNKFFWLFFVMMLCSGAAEQGMSQWASAFAEMGLKVSKTIGDLLGPCMFALFMGTARAFYGKFSEKLDLSRFMKGSCILCILSYLIAVFAPGAVISLIGCGLCGLSVGIMWPGTFSISAANMKRGGTAMFALLALAGDVGCSGGPTLVGVVSEALGENLKLGLLAGIVFPVVLLICLFLPTRAKESSDID